jgi:hypothetical protein
MILVCFFFLGELVQLIVYLNLGERVYSPPTLKLLTNKQGDGGCDDHNQLVVVVVQLIKTKKIEVSFI